MSEKSTAQTDQVRKEFREASRSLGIVGLNPALDAIMQPLYNGVRIYYCRDEEIKRVARTTDHSDRWQSPVSTSADRMKETLEAADEFDVIDKTTVNYLASGPLSDVRGIHEGHMWGIALMFGDRVESDRLTDRQLTAVPGIGETLARRAIGKIAAYRKKLEDT